MFGSGYVSVSRYSDNLNDGDMLHEDGMMVTC